MSVGIVLVHGYSGSPDDLDLLVRDLEAVYGADSVTAVPLPGHETENAPIFDKDSFVANIVSAVVAYRRQDRLIILLGYSTGGVLALAALAERSIVPALLVLASVPKKIDTAYLARWAEHRAGKREISFTSIASMVSLINTTGARAYGGTFPVLVLHGQQDELVPPEGAAGWEQGAFSGPVRTVLIPQAGHDLFQGPNSALAVDLVARAVADSAIALSDEDEGALAALYAVEPEVNRFFLRSPSSRRHVAVSPSGHTVADLRPISSPLVATEPIIANIEVTTRCNLRCTYCARTIRGSNGADMPKERFKTILGLLPHAYRITLVGLGETLLHPEIVDLVAEASAQGRRVGLVTNGMLLDESMSRELLKAGLESITFSIDGATQKITSEVRPGTDQDRVIRNVKKFVELSRSSRPISTAVFSAISTRTAPSLEELVDVIAGLGVHVLMLTDLNFKENGRHSLWKNADDRIAGMVRSGVARAFKKDLPVLSVRGLEEFGLWKRYAKFLLLPPDQLYRRSNKQAWCFSPWQTVPINIHGDVTLCDCQPEVNAGNLLTQPLAEIWNGEAFAQHRRRMLCRDPPEACRICPRF